MIIIEYCTQAYRITDGTVYELFPSTSIGTIAHAKQTNAISSTLFGIETNVLLCRC